MTKGLGMLIATAALAASCASAPPQAPAAAAASAASAELVPNDVLANSVYSRLNASPLYYYRHVNVAVDGGIAYLTGYVWSTEAIYEARRIAASVPGVRAVVTTQLELERNGRGNGVAR